MEHPKFKIKAFAELSADELYQLLRLRSDVFIVEQNCAYPDIDGKDYKAIHLLGEFGSKIVGYARLFAPGHYFDEASIGRVVIATEFRDRKWGHILMEHAVLCVKEHFGADRITISAQQHLKHFYEHHQFVQVSESYLEDDIPHIRMRRG